MSSSVLDLEKNIDKIKGIGPTNLKKLMSGGIITVNALAVLTTTELIEYTGMGVGTAESAISQARELIGSGFKSATQLLENDRSEIKHSTGSAALDQKLQGGIEGGAITMFSGEKGALKTQLCKTVAVICAATYGPVLVLDTEGIWGNNAVRLVQIAKVRGYDAENVLDNIIIARSYNREHLTTLTNDLLLEVKNRNVKMIIVDSIISHWREEFSGRGTLANRQQTLVSVAGKMKRVGEAYKIPIIFTDQVQAVVDNPYGPKLQPAGGHVLAHLVTYSALLYKGSKRKGETMDYQTSVIHDYDMASIPPFKVRIMCTEAGIVDEDGSYPEQQTLEETMEDE